MTAQTAGTALAAELRRYFHIGPRTRRYRTHNGNHQDLHAEMIEAIQHATYRPGYFTERTETILRAGRYAMFSYCKHVEGYRISGTKISAINAMTPWQFAAFLGQMVDAGIENVGEGETFLNAWQVAA